MSIVEAVVSKNPNDNTKQNIIFVGALDEDGNVYDTRPYLDELKSLTLKGRPGKFYKSLDVKGVKRPAWIFDIKDKATITNFANKINKGVIKPTQYAKSPLKSPLKSPMRKSTPKSSLNIEGEINNWEFPLSFKDDKGVVYQMIVLTIPKPHEGQTINIYFESDGYKQNYQRTITEVISNTNFIAQDDDEEEPDVHDIRVIDGKWVIYGYEGSHIIEFEPL